MSDFFLQKDNGCGLISKVIRPNIYLPNTPCERKILVK